MEMIWYAPVWGQSGYENLSRNLLMALDQLGVNIELRPDQNFNTESVGLPSDTVRRLTRMMQTRVSPLAPHILCQVPKGQPVAPDAPTLCYSLFETDRVPMPWRDAFLSMDRILVFSEFNRIGWMNSGIPTERIAALPPAVDSFLYNPDGPKLSLQKRKGFTFLCSGDYTERKNFEAVIEAYCAEFTSKDPVTLIFKCHFSGFTKKFRRDCLTKLKETTERFSKGNTPRILFWGNKVSDYAMAALYRSVDCFVLASRGEGLGMQYLESMASGIPIIATDWGAQSDYLNYDNSYPVRATAQLIDDPNYILKCIQALNAKWGQVDLADLRSAMKHVYQNQTEARQKVQLALEQVREFTWQRMAVRFIKEVVNMYSHKDIVRLPFVGVEK